ATMTFDSIALPSAIAWPAAGASVGGGSRVSISGTAGDAGGVVAGVEVSVDGGTSWHSATGGSSWTYSWVPGALGQVTIKSRAIDDSGNIEAAGAGINVTVAASDCPCPSLSK